MSPPKWAFMTADERDAHTEEARPRRLEVFLRRVRGEPIVEIAKSMGISSSMAYNDYKKFAEELLGTEYSELNIQKVVELMKNELITKAIWPRAEAGDLDAVGMFNTLQQTKIKLLGLNAPVKFQGVVAHLTGGRKKISQEELDDRMLGLYRRLRARKKLSAGMEEWGRQHTKVVDGEVVLVEDAKAPKTE